MTAKISMLGCPEGPSLHTEPSNVIILFPFMARQTLLTNNYIRGKAPLKYA